MKCIEAEITHGPNLVKWRTHTAWYSMSMYRFDNEHVLERADTLKSENEVIIVVELAGCTCMSFARKRSDISCQRIGDRIALHTSLYYLVITSK